MKRIALVLDSPKRDFYGIAAVAYWLIRNHKARPIIVGTQNEITALVKYVPHLLVMPHLRFHRHELLVSYAKAQGTKIAVIPVEGFPKTDRLIAKSVLGLEKFRKNVDLLLTWGDYVASYCRDNAVAPGTVIKTTGSPRFDINTPAYNSWFSERKDFMGRLQLPWDRPLIVWFSCTAWANLPVSEEAFANTHSNKLRSTHLVGDDLDLMALRRDDQKAFNYMTDLFSRFIREHPDFNYVIKPHPFEPQEPYQSLKALSPNVRVIDTRIPVAEIVRHADIQVNWQCSTSLEGWMFDIKKKTISIRTPGLELSEDFVPFVKGNDCVITYDDFVRRMHHYLDGGALPDGLEQKRKDYIHNYAAKAGHSGEACAQALIEHLNGYPEPRRRWANFRYIAAKQIPHWIWHRRWVMMRRPPSDHKYFSPESFHLTIEKYNRLFSTTVSSKDYDLEV